MLLNNRERLIVVGIVLGVDTVTYGGVPQNVGIAMIGDEILFLESRMLGGRLAQTLNLTAATIKVPE
jgi:hypothetical protein